MADQPERKTAYGRRVTQALIASDLNQTAAAIALTKRVGREVKPQTVQYLASKAEESALTADLAAVCSVRYEWLAYGRGAMRPMVKEPETDYDFATKVRGLVLAAGNGRVTWEHEEIENSHAFKRDWLQKKRLNLKHCRIIDVVGDSMAPHLQSGDVVLVNLEDKAVRSGEVYAIAVDGETRIKRLIKRADGAIEIKSDNPSPDNPDEVIPRDSLDRIHIIGRKVWRGG